MPTPFFDGSLWDNTLDPPDRDGFNTLVANLGIDTSGGGGSYGHGTYTSASCGGVTIGYSYHLPPTWTSEPTRKFPVVYVPSLGGGGDENSIFSRSQVSDPLADSPVYTSNQDGSPWFRNWGKNAKCVTIFCNGLRVGPAVYYDCHPSSPMHGVWDMESQTSEIIDFMEGSGHPIFGGRLVPQGTSDVNGGRYRGIMGHSGGTIHSIYHVTQHPERYASVFLLAIPGGTATPEPWFLQTCNDDATFNDSIRPIDGGTGGFGTPFSNNFTNIFNAGIWWHVQVSTPEGINETVSDGFSAALVSAGFNVEPEVTIPFGWHTDWAYTGSGGPQPLPWHVSKFKLDPTPNPGSYNTPVNTPLVLSSATIVSTATDPQLLTLSVSSVGSPVHGTVGLSGSTVTFTPATGYTGAASFDYTIVNTDGQTASATAAVSVSGTTPGYLLDGVGGARLTDDVVGQPTFGYDLTDALPGVAGTTTAVISSLNPSPFGTSVTFTATVTGTTPPPAPSGTVTFFDGATPIGSQSVSGAGPVTAALSTSGLIVGAHTITALYNGDANFSSSISPSLTQTVTSVVIGGTLYWAAEGDSRTASDSLHVPAAQMYPELIAAIHPEITLNNVAVSGSFLSDGGANTDPGAIITRGPTLDALIAANPGFSHYVLSVWIGANDAHLGDGSYDMHIYTGLLAGYCDDRRVAGWEVIVCTEIAEFAASDTTNYNNWVGFRAVFNPDVSAFSPAHADFVCDFDASALGPAAAAADATLFSDTIHPTALGQSLLMIPMDAIITAILAESPPPPPGSFVPGGWNAIQDAVDSLAGEP